MSSSIVTAVVAAGGNGLRMGPKLTELGIPCKSLIPVNGVPLISYVVGALLVSGIEEVVVCAEDENKISRLRIALSCFPRVVRFHKDEGRSTGYVIYSAEDYLSDPFVFTYGHVPIDPAHVRKLINRALDSQLPIVTGVSTCSEDLKLVVTRRDRIWKFISYRGSWVLRANQYFAEPPYCFPKSFLRSLEKGNEGFHRFSIIRGLLEYQSLVCMPSNQLNEMHCVEELTKVEKYAVKFKKILPA